MSRKSALPSLIIIIGLLLSLIVTVAQASPDSAKKLALTGYTYSAALEVKNNMISELPNGYTVTFTVNTLSLIELTRLQDDCDDLRITYTDGTETELNRLVSGCNTTSTTIQFRTQAAIAASSNDLRYTLYYGNPAAIDPPQNPANVYSFFDNFQDGDSTGWTVKAPGVWNVVNDSGNFVYRYTSGGVANWALSSAVVPFSDIDYLVKIRAVDSPNKTNWIGAAFRIQDPSNFLTTYESRDGNLFKMANVIAENHEPILNQSGFVMAANQWYWLRVQALGSTVRARIWVDGGPEPVTWTVSRTVATFQNNSNIGLTTYNHTTIADWDEITVRPLVANEPTVNLGPASWWDNSWGYRRPITLTNASSTTALPTRFSASFTLDTTVLIGSGQMLENCDDLRVVYDPGLSSSPLDRVVENCNSDHTTVWFALQRPIAASGQDGAYYLYYGNPAAGTPLANGMNVFLFFEDWEQGQNHWIYAGGLDSGLPPLGTMGTTTISTDRAFSSSNSQKFNVKAAGGDAFSGYIPVTPSTAYTFNVWASTPSSGICTPVGFNPYTTAYTVGPETWFWTDLWPTTNTWTARSYSFTTASDTAFLKLKSELWSDPVGCGANGAPPAYLDNLSLRYSINVEPTLALGVEETNLPSPVISNITATPGTVNLGNPIQVSADIITPEGTITSGELRILSPESQVVAMAFSSGSTWQTSFTPTQGGAYTYRIYATASYGRSRLSALHTFTVIDNQNPVISLVSIINPIQVRSTQILVVDVTDNGHINTVTVTVEGATHPMTLSGGHYSYSWQANTVGTIPYTVTATDSANNSTTLPGTFEVQPQAVEVCTWGGCKQAAVSWSKDDSINTCTADLDAAGIRGTFYVNGSTPQQWYADYSAVGHEIGPHTVSHPCDQPSCYPNCTPINILTSPYTTIINDFRTTELEPNIAAIEAMTGKPVLSGAWPCGCTNAGKMIASAYYVLGMRGYNDCGCGWVQDNNQPTPIMFMNLNGLHAFDQTFIDRAILDGTWTIVTAHSECTGIDYIGAHKDVLWTPTVGEGLKYIKVRDASQFSNYSRVGRTISFTAGHNLPDFTPTSITTPTPFIFQTITYNNPVTLKVHILDTDTVLSVTVDSFPVAHQYKTIDNVRYVIFDTPLNGSRTVVVNLGAPSPLIADTLATPNPVEFGSAIGVSANVTAGEGSTLGNVTLQLISPETSDHPMTLSEGRYSYSFTPSQLGSYTYRVTASNTEGTTAQSPVMTFTVRDTVAPSWQTQTQSSNNIAMNEPITLSAQGSDLGRLARAILSTNETGTWQDFDWPISNWWNHSWAHRRPITVTETAGLARTNETVDLLVEATTFTGLTSCNELRVAGADRIELPVQIIGTQPPCHLLFQANVAANSTQTYYVYYGNPAASAPSYTTDLTATTNGSLRTIVSTYFNLDLNGSASSGILSRVRLPLGSNTDLPLASSASYYWGWHQVCSSVDGNITGKNRLCSGGVADASGLVLTETLSGPLSREYTLTSTKGGATYSITYRFYANAPYYKYSITREGTSATVMNNFWYVNGNFGRLGIGLGGTPAESFNTYDNTTDHIRIASLAGVNSAWIDGTDNDGTDLGGTDYYSPTADSLNLYVTTGANQTAAQGVIARLSAPLALSALGTSEDAPLGQYGSPKELVPGTEWTTTSFIWQNPTINNQVIRWRIKYCDVSGNCQYTAEMPFIVGNPTGVDLNYFRAARTADGVQLSWETINEATLAGFNLYRRELDGKFEKLNASLIAPEKGGEPIGFAYLYLDDSAALDLRYEYRLEVIETNLEASASMLALYWPFSIQLPIIRH